MDIKRLIIGTVVGGITLYILGYIIWDMLFAEFYAANAGSATGVVKDPQAILALPCRDHTADSSDRPGCGA